MLPVKSFLAVPVIVATCFLSSCRSAAPQMMSAEAQRRFDYYYMEAVKKKLASEHAEAFVLFQHCLEADPHAGEAMYELGLYYLGLREDSIGESYLRGAVLSEPDNIHYKEALASYYLRKRDAAKAVPVLEDMARCNPARTDVLSQLVSLYMDAGEEMKAIKSLDAIETIEGKNVGVSLEKFKLYRELGREEEAFAELDSLAAENPNDMAYKVLVGDHYLLVQKPEKAYEIYMEVQRKEPDNQALKLSLLDYYRQMGQDSLYNALLDSLLYGSRTDEQIRVMLMRNFVLEQENAHADSTVVLDVFARVLDNTPESVPMLALYASYLNMKKMDPQMVADVMERILAIEPDNRAALFNLMEHAFRMNDYAKAVEICRKGINHYPEELPFYFYLGFSSYQLGLNGEALEAFRVGVEQATPETDPSLVSDMYSIMGDLLYKEGKKDAAYAAYDSSLVYKADNIMCLNNYAYFLSLDNERLDEAEEMSYRAIKAEPDNKTYLDTYAWILFMKGRYGEAKIYMEKVVKDASDDDEEVTAGVLEHAGDIYAMCGDLEQALAYWRRAQAKGGDVTPLLSKKIKLKKYIKE